MSSFKHIVLFLIGTVMILGITQKIFSRKRVLLLGLDYKIIS